MNDEIKEILDAWKNETIEDVLEQIDNFFNEDEQVDRIENILQNGSDSQ